jgi:hypothetical protein
MAAASPIEDKQWRHFDPRWQTPAAPAQNNLARAAVRDTWRRKGWPAAPGAALMQERTAFRLAMLANGFQPLLNAPVAIRTPPTP